MATSESLAPEFIEENEDGNFSIELRSKTAGQDGVDGKGHQNKENHMSFDQKADEFINLVNRFEGSDFVSLWSADKLNEVTDKFEQTLNHNATRNLQ